MGNATIGTVDLAYARLAAAIIESGKKTNDEEFLKSDWCELLQSMVMIGAGMTRDKLTPNAFPRGSNL